MMKTLTQQQLFNLCFQHLLKVEGGESKHAADLGGHTKYGISKRQYPHLDIAALTLSDARHIYHKDFWLKYRCPEFQPVAAVMLFDAVVNHNPLVAIRMLQRAVRVKADGLIGPKTLTAVNNAAPKTLVSYTLSIRSKFYCSICLKNPSQTVFLLGWQRRLFSLQQFIYTHLTKRSLT